MRGDSVVLLIAAVKTWQGFEHNYIRQSVFLFARTVVR